MNLAIVLALVALLVALALIPPPRRDARRTTSLGEQRIRRARSM